MFAIYYMFEVEYFMFNLSLDLRCSYAVQTTYMEGGGGGEGIN